jgi:hypothetical protein
VRSEPVAERAQLPDGYGLPADSKLLTWAEIDARLRAAKHYWIGTAGSDGVPIVRPVDGMWHECALYFGSDPQSRWQRNLVANPRATMHLEDAERAVIVEGVVEVITLDHDLSVPLVADSNAKYDMGQTLADYVGQEISVLRPHKVLAWNLLYEDATRFRFDASAG